MKLNLERMRAALREAADVATNALEHQPEATGECWQHLSAAVGKVHQATRLGWANLVNPPRNCDVGTEKEQSERYKAYCRKHFTPDQLGGNCRACPLKDIRGWSCQLAWAQMPYEEAERK